MLSAELIRKTQRRKALRRHNRGMAEQEQPSSSAKPKFTYEVFIDELRDLYAQGHKFPAREANAESVTFKRWKLHLIDLLDTIEDAGYEIRCGVRSRIFQAMYGGHSSGAFLRDLTDTLNEMDLVIQKFEKRGAPVLPYKEAFGSAPKKSKKAENEPATVQAPQPLTLPQQISWKWVWEHVPISWFWYAGIGLVAAFAGGITVGKYADSVDKALHPEHPAVTPAPAPPPQTKPAPTPGALSTARPVSK